MLFNFTFRKFFKSKHSLVAAAWQASIAHHRVCMDATGPGVVHDTTQLVDKAFREECWEQCVREVADDRVIHRDPPRPLTWNSVYAHGDIRYTVICDGGATTDEARAEGDLVKLLFVWMNPGHIRLKHLWFLPPSFCNASREGIIIDQDQV